MLLVSGEGLLHACISSTTCKQGENIQIYLIIYTAKFRQRTTTTCVLFLSLRMRSGKTAEQSYTTPSKTKH